MTNNLHETTDAVVWADAFLKIIDKIGEEYITQDFVVGWFANAFAAAEMNQTAVQAIEHARNRAFFHTLVSDEGNHEMTVAIHKLEEARMWFTRGLAIIQGKFDPADLERDDA